MRSATASSTRYQYSRVVAGPRRDRALVAREVGVGNDELGVDLEPGAEPVAGLAGAVRRVEREVPRSELVEREAAEGARERLREVLDLLVPRRGSGRRSRRCPRRARAPSRSSRRPDGGCRAWRRAGRRRPRSCACRSWGAGSARTGPGPRRRSGRAGSPCARGPRGASVLALAAPHDRRQHLEPGALGQLHHLVDDLLRGLPADRAPAVGAMRVSDPGVQHPQVVVDLGDGADRRAGVPRGRLLVDRDGRREPLDEVDVGLLHLPEELPGVGGQGLHVPPLALGVDRVEGEGGLAGAGQPREHDQAVTGELQRDVLEVVLTGAVDDEACRCPRRASVVAARDTPDERTYPSLAWNETSARRPCSRRSRPSIGRRSSPGPGELAPGDPHPSPDGRGSRSAANVATAGGHATRPDLPGRRRRVRAPPDLQRAARRRPAPWSPDGRPD